MLPIKIDNLVSQRTVESARIEYKGDWNPEPVVHTICAFANDIDNLGGGYVLIGIEEENGMPKLPVKGLNINAVDKISRDLLNICNLVEPRYVPILEHAHYEGKDILVLWAPGGDQRPYKCPVRISANKSEKSEKAYYVRKLSNTIRANHYEERELFELSAKEPYDDRINHSADIGDLRPNLISTYLKRVDSDMYSPSLTMKTSELALNMRVARGPSEYIKPLNVGLMFFNERPDNYFRYARIEIVDKPDPTGNGMTEKMFVGPLNVQLEDALRYIENYIIKERVDKRPDKAEADRTFNYPFRAVEETISNAVYHRDYQIPEPITVTVMPDRMEILSFPGPDRYITDEDLKAFRMVSIRYRNRRIGDFLKELKLTEGRNTGIPAILHALKLNNSESPIFETDAERTYFKVIFPVNKKFLPCTPGGVSRVGVRRTSEKLRQDIVAELSERGETSVNELSRALGYGNNTKSVYKMIGQLIEEGLMEYTHPDKKNSRNQKILLR